MKIWIDADACPTPAKAIVFRAARRLTIPVTLVANQPLPSPPSSGIDTVQVSTDLDAADQYLMRHASPGDLVITADIPLAAALVARGVAALDPRGELYTDNTIADRLASRNLMERLRAAGVVGGGPAPYDNRDKHAFANRLDRWLARHGPRGSW